MTTETKKKKSTYKPVSPAVAQAAEVLMCIGCCADSQMSLTQICQEVNIHKSKGYSILNALIQYDIITKDPSTKAYSLGPQLISLAKKVQDNLDLRHIAEPFLKKLAKDKNSTALLGTISKDQLFITSKYEGGDTIGVTIRQHQSMHVTHGAHGKAIFAFMDEENRERLIQQGKLEFYGENSAVDFDLLEKELSQCRKTGYATDKGEISPYINAVSSPIFDHDLTVVGAIILVGTYRKSKIREYGKSTADISQKISRKMGAEI